MFTLKTTPPEKVSRWPQIIIAKCQNMDHTASHAWGRIFVGVCMNNAQAAGALVTDVFDRADAIRDGLNTVLPVTYVLPPESGAKLRGIFTFQGPAVPGRLVGDIKRACAALTSLLVGALILITRGVNQFGKSRGVVIEESHNSLNLTHYSAMTGPVKVLTYL